MSFDPDTLEPHRPPYLSPDDEDDEGEPEAEPKPTATQPNADGSSGAPIAHALKQRPIPWPKENELEPTRAGENRPGPTPALHPQHSPDNELETAEQVMVANGTSELDGPAFELRP
jgi:hypothetical protein